MDNGSTHDRKTIFLWGTALTWVQFVLFIIGIFVSFRGISEQKATGLGAIAGGLSKAYLIYGLIVAVLSLIAIVLLSKSFSSGHRMRALFSVFYIGWNAVLLMALAVLTVWLRHTLQ
jgi:hypothetical protein